MLIRKLFKFENALVVRGCSTQRCLRSIGTETDLALPPQLSAAASKFSEDVARTNNELALGYKKVQNEF